MGREYLFPYAADCESNRLLRLMDHEITCDRLPHQCILLPSNHFHIQVWCISMSLFLKGILRFKYDRLAKGDTLPLLDRRSDADATTFNFAYNNLNVSILIRQTLLKCSQIIHLHNLCCQNNYFVEQLIAISANDRWSLPLVAVSRVHQGSWIVDRNSESWNKYFKTEEVFLVEIEVKRIVWCTCTREKLSLTAL